MDFNRSFKNKHFLKYIEIQYFKEMFDTQNSFLNYLSSAAANCLFSDVQRGV